jgi:hypothetical protein
MGLVDGACAADWAVGLDVVLDVEILKSAEGLRFAAHVSP